LLLSTCNSAFSNEKVGFKLISYNIWQTKNIFSTLNNTICSTFKLRCNNNQANDLINIIISKNPEIFVLQEASIDFINQLNQSNPEYFSFYSEKSSLAIFSKFDFISNSYTPFPSYMNRGMILSKLLINKQEICLVNTHLESLLDDIESRKRQLTIIFKKLSSCDISILAGDFNFSDNSEEQSKIPSYFHDSWLINKQDPGFTYNLENNALAHKNALYRENSRRLDRIFYTGNFFTINSITLLGTKSPTPSDHYGLIAKFNFLNSSLLPKR